MVGFLLHVVGLLLWPGAATSLLFGLICEYAVEWTRSGKRPSFDQVRAVFLNFEGFIPRAVPVFLIALPATIQMTVPFDPVSSIERNVAVAAACLTGATWLASWSESSKVRVAGQVGLWAAVIAPTLDPQNLRPQVIGQLFLAQQIPVKLGAAALFLMCMPALTGLIAKAQPEPARLGLWWPLCGLFVSEFIQPASQDVLGLVLFLAIALAVAQFTIAATAAMTRHGSKMAGSLVTRVAFPFSGFVVLLGAVLPLLNR